MSDLARDHALLLEATREAGELALSYYGKAVERWLKIADEPVSEADMAVDAFLRERLGTARPDYGWLSEESEDNDERLSRDRVWIVDPIDGTRAFLATRPEFTVCVALIEAGRPIAAAVFNPASAEFFEARVGHGATLNGERLAVSAATELSGARLLANRSLNKRLEKGLSAWPKVERSYFNSIAYRAALVGTGRFDAAVSGHGVSDWDIAAADLIVREAGGRVSDRDGETLVYNRATVRHNGLVVACPGLHKPLCALMAALAAQAPA